MLPILVIALLTASILAADLNTDLQAAVKAGDAKLAAALIKQGANVNARSAIGAAPIHEAAWSGNTELLDLLIAHGADVNARHADGGSTPCTTPSSPITWPWSAPC